MQARSYLPGIAAVTIIAVVILLNVDPNNIFGRAQVAAKRNAQNVISTIKKLSATTENIEKTLKSVQLENGIAKFALSAVAKEKKKVETDIANAKKDMKLMALEIEALRKIKDEKKEYEEMVNHFAHESSKNALTALQWSGHGPEKGLYNFTVLTAMMDIGRGQWKFQARPYNSYLLYMMRVLKLDVNFIVFADSKAAPFIRWMRRGRERRTVIVGQEFKDLPYYKLKERFSDIMASDEYKKDNELVKGQLAEAIHPEYDILQLSKLYFMDRAARENPFNTTYFMWLDGGYGHGNNVHPKDHIWRPKGVFEFPNQATFIEMGEGVKHFEPVKHKINKLRIAIIAGLFFGGGGHVFKELYKMQKEEVKRWAAEGIVDDDQTMYMTLYYRKPELFHLVRGDWYDVFKLFHYPKES